MTNLRGRVYATARTGLFLTYELGHENLFWQRGRARKKCFFPFPQLRGMIGHDPPAFFEFAEQESEFAFGIVLVTSERPAADDKCGILGKQVDLQI